jgi:hypothetical protein
MIYNMSECLLGNFCLCLSFSHDLRDIKLTNFNSRDIVTGNLSLIRQQISNL